MKLDYIEVCGFRGFRDNVRIDFGAGFTVINGRNGVGKSTLCDAIEFAITGEIGKYSVETAAKESVRDYVWWRGDGVPSAYFVTAAFSDTAGRRFTVTRTREGGADRSEAELRAALCQGAAPEDPLRQLAKTSIIRDEWIAALSLDLTETQRFDLVRAALGAIEGGGLTAKAKAVVSAAEASFKRTEELYDNARAMLSGALVQRSEASEAAARSADVTVAMRVLDTIVAPEAGEDVAARLDRARRLLQAWRWRLDAMGEAIFQGRELEALRRDYDNPQANAKRSMLASSREEARKRRDKADAERVRAERQFEFEARASDIAASLSALVEHGDRLGLDEGHCPLCAAVRSDEAFRAGLALARARIDMLAQGVNAAREALASARVTAREAESAWKEAEAAWEVDAHALTVIRAREEAYVELFREHELPLGLVNNLEALERDRSAERDRLLEIERALNALEASQAVGRLASIDSRVTALRQQMEGAAQELAQGQAALSAAKSLEKSVRRSASEIIDERLALISPLLNELYQRLRPHSDWRSIEYSIRGDVRRFLSLKVGNDLNPQFVFSSGQRRAAGLAFLLSVHLARSWSRWSTLVLDDPVQHIDDFRALHLVEVLSALRQGGRQIICAVEDEALANLLCRRLLSTAEEPGRRVTIDVDAKESGDIVSLFEIAPMTTSVRRASERALQAG